MDNLLSYCGLVNARIRTSEKDLPVQTNCVYNWGQTLFDDWCACWHWVHNLSNRIDLQSREPSQIKSNLKPKSLTFACVQSFFEVEYNFFYKSVISRDVFFFSNLIKSIQKFKYNFVCGLWMEDTIQVLIISKLV